MIGFCVVVAGLEVGEVADEILEVESVVVTVHVEHSVHDEVADGVHVNLLAGETKCIKKLGENT